VLYVDKAIRDRLNTQDKLLKYGVVQEVQCALCGLDTENLDRLFFNCTFSERIWEALCDKCNPLWASRRWKETIQ
jgi:hypothetical protein